MVGKSLSVGLDLVSMPMTTIGEFFFLQGEVVAQSLTCFDG